MRRNIAKANLANSALYFLSERKALFKPTLKCGISAFFRQTRNPLLPVVRRHSRAKLVHFTPGFCTAALFYNITHARIIKFINKNMYKSLAALLFLFTLWMFIHFTVRRRNTLKCIHFSPFFALSFSALAALLSGFPTAKLFLLSAYPLPRVFCKIKER